MSSANGESGDNRQTHEDVIEMKSLFKMLVESQNKQAESLAKLVETQANTQQQILEILGRSTNTGDIAGGSGVDKQETAQVPNNSDDDEEPELDRGREADYVLGEHDLLFVAINDNDVETAIKYLNDDPTAIEKGIGGYDKSTALHRAVYWSRITIVEEILKLARGRPLLIEYRVGISGVTALHLAASRGNAEVAEMLVGNDSRLTQMRDYSRMTPLENALLSVTAGQRKVVEYLYPETRDEKPSPFRGHDGARLLCNAIDAGFYDLAQQLVKRFPKLVTAKSRKHDACALELLVRKPYAFGIGNELTWWQDCVYSLIQVDMNSTTSDKSIFMPYLGRAPCITKFYNLKLMHKQAITLLRQMIVELKEANIPKKIIKFFQTNPDIMKLAIKHGIIVFIAECLEHFGYLTWYNMSGQRMLHMAVAERNATIVSLICDWGDSYDDKIKLVTTIDNDENNTVLHYAAKIAPPAQLNLISGVTLQIQRELQWLKGVESIIPDNYKYNKNKEGHTAQYIFTKEHKELVKEGEGWMKDTAGSCMIVAALIATVSFAAAFTVPGGNISDSDIYKSGTPVFLGKASFTVFAGADAVALFSSIASVLMFLAIYTSRYAEMDFLKSLPQKLIIGLATLFISMAAILVAFCASMFIVVRNKFPQGIIPIALFGCVPVILFAWLQLPLFYEMVRSTYWGSILQKHKYKDPRVEKNNKKKKENIVSRAKKLIKSF